MNGTLGPQLDTMSSNCHLQCLIKLLPLLLFMYAGLWTFHVRVVHPTFTAGTGWLLHVVLLSLANDPVLAVRPPPHSSPLLLLLTRDITDSEWVRSLDNKTTELISMLSPSLSITAKFSTTWNESIALEEWQEDLGSGDKRWLLKWGRDGYQRTRWSQSSNLEIRVSFKNC